MTWPFENDTSSLVKTLAKRSSQNEKRRSIMVTVSVALAAFLISFGGGLAVSLVQMQNNQVTDTYEAVYSGITEQSIAKLGEQPQIARVGQYYLLGQEQSAQGFTGSFIYADEPMLYIGRQQMALAEGGLPVQANEVLVSSAWLDKYAPHAKTGDTVTLDTASFHGKYIISGVMDALQSESSETYGFILSKEQLKQHKDYDPSGYRAYIHLYNDEEMSPEEIKAYFEITAEEYSLPLPSYNSQYFSLSSTHSSKSLGSVAAIGLLAAIVLIGGCVVIQSIFRISIIGKVQCFGQLRTLGATKKQIKQMVWKEGRRPAWCGILPGTLLGILLPIFLVPDGLDLVGYGAVILTTVSICWIMVRLSLGRPIKIAANISPIEAVRFNAEQKTSTRPRPFHRKLNPLTIGLMNFCRDKKKTASILLSLSIGGILLLIASTLLLTYSPEAYARTNFPNGDYKIYIDSERDLSDILYSGNPLTRTLRQEILRIDGVEDILVTRQGSGLDFKSGPYSSGGMCDMITDDNYRAIEAALTDGTMPTDAHEILIPEEYTDMQGKGCVGSTLQISLGGKTSIAAVTGTFDLAKVDAGTGHGDLALDGAMFFLPKKAFLQLLPGVKNFDYSWDIISDPAKKASVKAGLQDLVNSHTEIALDDYSDKVSYNRSVYSNLFHILQGIALSVALFGVINLVNTTLSNQLSRKREVTLLRSAGLTKKQLYQASTYEGICYALSSVFLSIFLGLPIGFLIHRTVSLKIYGTVPSYQFPTLYMGLYALLLLALEFILSTWTIRNQRNLSLVEQLKSTE